MKFLIAVASVFVAVSACKTANNSSDALSVDSQAVGGRPGMPAIQALRQFLDANTLPAKYTLQGVEVPSFIGGLLHDPKPCVATVASAAASDNGEPGEWFEVALALGDASTSQSSDYVILQDSQSLATNGFSSGAGKIMVKWTEVGQGFGNTSNDKQVTAQRDGATLTLSIHSVFHSSLLPALPSTTTCAFTQQ